MSNKIQLLKLITLLLLLTAVTATILISTGIFDPKPVGDLQWEKPLPTVNLEPQSPQLLPLDINLPNNDYSLRLTAVHQSGDSDSSFGLVLGEQSPLIIALSPLGYTAIWEQTDSSFSTHHSAFYLPWQPWPHIRPDENEIGVDVIPGQEPNTANIIVRVNREILWTGEGVIDDGVGLYGETFGDTAVIDFQNLQLFSP